MSVEELIVWLQKIIKMPLLGTRNRGIYLTNPTRW